MEFIPGVIADLKWRWSPLQIQILQDQVAEFRMPEYELKKLLAQHYNTTPKVDQVAKYILSQFEVPEAISRNQDGDGDEKRYTIIQIGKMKFHLHDLQEREKGIYSFVDIPTAPTEYATVVRVRQHIKELAEIRNDERFLFEVGFFMLALSVSKTDEKTIPILEFDPVTYFEVEDHPILRIGRTEYLLDSVTEILEK